MHVMKKVEEKDGDDDEEEFWPRLLKDKALEKNRVSIAYVVCGIFTFNIHISQTDIVFSVLYCFLPIR